MADDERLVVLLEARIKDLEKNMAKASGTTAREFGKMQKASASATKQMEADMNRSTTRINHALASTSGKIGELGKSFSAGLIGRAIAATTAFLAFSSVISKTKEALDQFGKIADSSAASGLDPEMFQELAYQASLAGVEVDTLSSALQTFSKNSGLAVAGKGKMVKTLQALNPLLLENIRHAKDQEERVRLAADAIDKAKTASEKAAIATTLFGDAGARLVPVFDGGSAAMDRTAASAQALGLIVDRDLIARSDELGDQVDTVSKLIDVQLSQSFVSLGPILIKSAELIANVAMGLGAVVDRWQDLENMTGRGLEMKVKTLGMEDLELERKILEKQAEARDVSPLASSLGFGTDSAVVQKEISELVAQRAENARQQTEIMKILSDRDKAAAEGLTRPKPVTEAPVVADLPVTASAPKRDKAAEEAERQAEAVKKVIENLEFERAQVGMTETEIAKMNALRQAGAAATDEQKEKIVELIEATASEKAAIDQVKASMDFAKEAANSFLSDLRAGLEDGKLDWEDFGTAALNVLNRIIDKIQGQLVDALFEIGSTSGGGLGGILGALFGGGGSQFALASSGKVAGLFSDGGYTGDGGKYDPAGIVHRGEYVFSKEAVNRIGAGNLESMHRNLKGYASGGLVGAPRLPEIRGGGGGGQQAVKVDVGVSVDQNGNLKAYVRDVVVKTGGPMMKAGLDKFSKTALPKRVNQIASDPRKVG